MFLFITQPDQVIHKLLSLSLKWAVKWTFQTKIVRLCMLPPILVMIKLYIYLSNMGFLSISKTNLLAILQLNKLQPRKYKIL